MTIARISAFNRIKAYGWDVKFVQTVHDSIVVDSHQKHVQQIVNLFHEVFKDLQPNIKKLFNYEWVVPLECEVKVGVNQKDMQEMKPAY